MSVFKVIEDVLVDDQGATAVEYGLIITLIVIAMVSALEGVANVTIDMWEDVSDNVTTS